MSGSNTCPECGKALPPDAPQGLCPECLMHRAMETGSAAGTVSSGVHVETEAVEEIQAVEECAGRYTLIGEHGKGGMGKVLLIHDEHLGRDIALKELLPDLGDGSTPSPFRHSKEMAARFLREAKITGQLEHPSITPVHELGRRQDGTLYYTMKLVRGRTLDEAIKEAGSNEKRLKLLPHFVDLCQAIAYAHSRGVIHRDIKPSNVMIGDYGETVVIDWGLAKVKGKEDLHADDMQKTVLAMRTDDTQGKDSGIETVYGQAMGTPVYMPPEQAEGKLEQIDERSDIYSLGAVLYEILTGRTPFAGRSLQQILHSVIHEEPKSINSLERKCPHDLIRFCERALRKDPAQRQQSAKELAEAVEGSKLRPPKGRLKKFVQRGAIFLVIFMSATVLVANILSSRRLERTIEEYESAGYVLDVNSYLAKYSNPSNEQANDSAPMNAAGFLYHFKDLYKGREKEGGSLEPIFEVIQYIRSGEEIPSQKYEELKALVLQHRGMIDRLREYSRVPKMSLKESLEFMGATDSGVWDARVFVDVRPWLAYAGLLTASAYCDWHEGDIEQALDTCFTALLVAQQFSQDPILSAQMMATTLMEIPFRFLQAHQEVLAKAKPETLQSFADALGRIDLRGNQQRVWAFEAVLVAKLFEEVKHGDPAKVRDWLPLYRPQPGKSFSWRIPNVPVFFMYGSLPLRWMANNDQCESIQFYKTAISLSDRPYSEVETEAIAADRRLYPGAWAAAIIWDYSDSDREQLAYTLREIATAETQKNIVALTALVHRHKARSGKFPESLEELGADVLSEFNFELLTGQPLEYELSGSGFQLRPPREALDRLTSEDRERSLLTWGNNSV